MNENKVRGLKWFFVKHKGCVLHFSLIFFKNNYALFFSWVMSDVKNITNFTT